MIGRLARRVTVCSSDPVEARWEGLQFDRGEGPQWEVMKTGMPVLSADLYRTTPGELDAGTVALAHSLANQVVSAAVPAAIRSAEEEDTSEAAGTQRYVARCTRPPA